MDQMVFLEDMPLGINLVSHIEFGWLNAEV